MKIEIGENLGFALIVGLPLSLFFMVFIVRAWGG